LINYKKDQGGGISLLKGVAYLNVFKNLKNFIFQENSALSKKNKINFKNKI
jgi:hypothetical protein